MEVIKRDNTLETYNGDKIILAISKAMTEVEGYVDLTFAEEIEEEIRALGERIELEDELLFVEDIQDEIEKRLMKRYPEIAKAYILYRAKREREREQPHKYKYLSKEFLKPYSQRVDSFPTELGRMVYKRTYSRPLPKEGRREEWWETVARVVEFSTDLEITARQKQGQQISQIKMNELIKTAEKMYEHIFELGVFPSGRSLWVGGTESSYAYPLSNFNCSFITIDDFEKFSEMFFVLMLGTGVGLSVERKYIEKLPKVNTGIRVIHKDYTPVRKIDRLEHTELEQVAHNTLQINVGDSKFGWSQAMKIYLDIVTNKQYADIELIVINYDSVRPKGERLKTFGGFASGHGNLKTMFEKIDLILKDKPKGWQKIKPIDALDMATIIAENVVSGGVRRSALIIFADHDEEEVIKAKADLYRQATNGQWEVNKELIHRSLSNNTIKYYAKPSSNQLEWHVNTMRYNGEPAFLNMEELMRRREDGEGGNPCMEIILRDRGVCNLTEVNMANYVYNGKIDYEALYEAQRISATIGYRMATIELEIHKWNLVNEEDRLVGCSLTGITDFMQEAQLDYKDMKPIFNKLREVATETVNKLADDIGLNRPKLVTTIKPSGTVSQLPTVASGLHFNHSKYYIRRVRVNADDPVAKALAESGFKWSPEVGQTTDNHNTKVFEFPIKSKGNYFKEDIGAIEQLEWYKLIMKEYVDHNASITVHVRDEEWEEVAKWLEDNWNDVLGVSFLPYDGGVYELAPYEKIDEETYNKLLAETPRLDTELINKYENFEDEFDVLDSSCDTGFCPVR